MFVFSFVASIYTLDSVFLWNEIKWSLQYFVTYIAYMELRRGL